jgi:hypothetical protein
MVHIVMLFIYHWRFLCAVFFSCCVEAFFASTAGSSSVMRFGWNHRRLERKEHGNANVCVTSINVLVTVQKSITGSRVCLRTLKQIADRCFGHGFKSPSPDHGSPSHSSK